MNEIAKFETGDAYKDEVQNQWDQDPCGSHYVEVAEPDTLEWFLEAERYRYGTYAPWMHEMMEFARHSGEKVLEIGGGMGTDHAQFATHGAATHDLDLSSGHLALAKRNFELRGLQGEFRHGDGESIPYPDGYFDLIYSNGVIHHTPNTATVVQEIYRALKPGGRVIIMVYAENSLHYWRNLFAAIGLAQSGLESASMGEIMSRSVELSEHGAKPLVKVYTAKRLRKLFDDFAGIRIYKRQLIQEELPRRLQWMPLDLAGRLMGWNLIIKARKPGRRRANTTALEAATTTRSRLEKELFAAGSNFSTWLETRKSETRLYTEAARPFVSMLAGDNSPVRKDIIAAAEFFCRHEFDLLGSGPFVPVDPDRAAQDGYTPIDWYLDPVRKLRFPRGVPHKDWKLFEMRPGNADIKYPWELARSQHWMTLAQAWQMTRDETFAREIARQLDDFMAVNPVGIGVNWTCTMDVAIRAANWALALALIHDCHAFDGGFWLRAKSALFDHADFIFSNLENKYEVTSNHFLSNVVGLHVLAAEFFDLKQGQAWDIWCRRSLETEIDVQIHEDGADFESSVPYHRLVTELFMASARLAQLQGRPLSEHYRGRLEAMVDFVVATNRPDGLMPVIGDADDGRFHIFTNIIGWNRQDARHLMAPAALLLNRSDWLAHGTSHAAWEAAWWGNDPACVKTTSASSPKGEEARLFRDIGVAVARRGGHYLAITNGAVGTKGFGNHKHNELLGFEYHRNGVPILVDAGNYVYTSDFAARNVFRGTLYHNTVCIDGMEQNEMNPEWIFRLFEKADPEHLDFSVSADTVRYAGRHHGFKRLPQPVIHERFFTFMLSTGALTFEDRLVGEGAHDVTWHFHCAPDVRVKIRSPRSIELVSGSNIVIMDIPAGLTIEEQTGGYSPSYGRTVPVRMLNLKAKVELSGDGVWAFAFKPDNGAGPNQERGKAA